MKYLGPESIHFPSGKTHESPCMTEYWRKKPIYHGVVKKEEYEEKDDVFEEDDEYTDD